ncbi:MAG: CYTH domain-containing protein [Opitutales bacterium]
MREGKFVEIEHKYRVGEDFDLGAFEQRLLAAQPEQHYTVETTDTYFLLPGSPGWIYRHRRDARREELTVKNRTADSEHRTEINLALALGPEPQHAAVEAFLRSLGELRSAVLHKTVRVFYFPACEIVHYTAVAGGRTVHCVELEARGTTDLAAARQTLAHYTRLLGLEDAERERRSLYDLLLASELEG